jgi:hypothetical protein
MMRILPSRGKQMLWHWLTLGLFSLGLVPILSPRPAIGAERISLSYGALRQTVSIGQLETYADTGKISDDLAMYVRLAPSEQLTRLRQILLLRIPVNTNRIAPFLSSPMGEQLLQHLASLIGHNASEFNSVALRAALMQAASDPDGLTLLNVLRQFPTEQVEIDLARTLEVVATWRELNQQTSKSLRDDITFSPDRSAATGAFHLGTTHHSPDRPSTRALISG